MPDTFNNVAESGRIGADIVRMQAPAEAASIIQDTILHTANVAVHVVFGTLALGLGVIQLARRRAIGVIADTDARS